ncbi:protein phosphatase 2C [Trypanosoma grayi]|uniref:protein phosphatase 2C n=1 Tax=Trypanosoma grayi TaxID=71804 RepID=UPI0004F459EC|nr:protein phosphatase 2C [Trypanosoma grayi]KEG14993.1 protein phosphatase 2C [Trypanosoma grayi]
MFQAFPLQHKKMLRLSLPFISVGFCEVMNCATRDNMSSFAVHNTHNRGAYPTPAANTKSRSGDNSNVDEATLPVAVPFMADAVAGGMCDSFTGHHCSRSVAQYLAWALGIHSVLPGAIAELRRELKDDPIIALMMSALSRERALHGTNADQRVVRRIFSEWEMQQYAMFADSAFFDACRKDMFPAGERKRDDGLRENMVANSGCRAVWFTAAVAPFGLQEQRRCGSGELSHRGAAPPPERWVETRTDVKRATAKQIAESATESSAPSPRFCLDVLVSNVGDSRAFGIQRHPLSQGERSTLDPLRERIVPLSADHKPLRTQELRRILKAGGEVRSDVGNIIDGNPFYNISRSFGHWSMKCDSRRAPSEQKIIALPTCSSWEMLAGDVLVLCNHAVFETRLQEDTSVDELAKVVRRELDRGASPEEAAGTVCDYAIRFGAQHSLQVVVAVATDDGSTSSCSEAQREEWVTPGPIYAEPCRRLPEYRQALQADCERCGVTLAELLLLRWRRVRDVLHLRHALPLMPYYGKECSILQQSMDEEAELFGQESLPPPGQNIDELTEKDWQCIAKTFEKLSRLLMAPTAPLAV